MSSPQVAGSEEATLFKRRTVIAMVVAGLLAFASLYLFVYEPSYDGLIASSDRTLIFAHRGFGRHAPDNSLIGARMALDSGLDGVDVDAQLSRDKEVVIFHDVSLERFTTHEGRVDSKTAAELQTYDLAIKYGKGFTDVFIPTFEEFVREIVPRGLLMVELKVSSVGSTGIEERVDSIIGEYDAYERVFISSFNPFVLRRLKRIDPRIRTVFIFQDSDWSPERVAETREEDRVSLPWFLRTEWTRVAIRKLVSPDALSIHHQVDERVIDKLMSKGYPVFLWPLNEDRTINWGLAKRPYGIVTDEPPLAKAVREAFER